MNNREYFNAMADQWDCTVNHDDHKIRYLLELVNIKKGSRILDVGTGTGVMIPFLRNSIGCTGSIIAVDQAEEMIKRARKKFCLDNVSFITGDVFELPMVDNYFDYIICYSVFPHFEDQEEAIYKLARLLRHGGSLAICHSQGREEINRCHKSKRDTIQCAELPSAVNIKNYLEYAGLTTIISVDNKEMFAFVGRKE